MIRFFRASVAILSLLLVACGDKSASSSTEITNFAVTPDALIFYFAPYQVAAYAAGPQTVQIPLAQISGVLAPPFNGTP